MVTGGIEPPLPKYPLLTIWRVSIATILHMQEAFYQLYYVTCWFYRRLPTIPRAGFEPTSVKIKKKSPRDCISIVSSFSFRIPKFNYRPFGGAYTKFGYLGIKWFVFTHIVECRSWGYITKNLPLY